MVDLIKDATSFHYGVNKTSTVFCGEDVLKFNCLGMGIHGKSVISFLFSL